MRTVSSRNRQSDHPTILVCENKKLTHPHSSVAPLLVLLLFGSTVHLHRDSNVHLHGLNSLKHIRHFSRAQISRTHNFWNSRALFLSSPLPQNGSRVTPRHGPCLETIVSVSCAIGEADAYFSFARRARQYVEGRKKQERCLCGPRLEAQLTGQKLQSRGAGQDGCQRNMVWKFCCASSRPLC